MNRQVELDLLRSWWRRRGSVLGVVWGRRRVGKTALLQEFAREHPAVFHTGAGRPRIDELRALSAAAATLETGRRDLAARPFVNWDDALEVFADAAAARPILLVLDEFPELLAVSPELPGVLRAFLERARSRTKLRIALCGSAVRTMTSMQEERAPLYGRSDLTLLLHPFEPHEASLMLPALAPSDRAVVWGIVGGVPLYLTWWNQAKSVRQNLLDLVCTPGGRLLIEGELMLAADLDSSDLSAQVLRAIATGRTKYNEIADAVRAEPARALDRLIELRLVERVVPVTEDPRRSRRRLYRVADNFLLFWLGVVDRYRAEIERGLGKTIVRPLLGELDEHMGGVWEEAFRAYLRRLAAAGRLAPDVVAIGRWWDAASEIDAVVLAGRRREAVLVGEAKWRGTVSAPPIEWTLSERARRLPRVRDRLGRAIAAREAVRDVQPGALAVTTADVFPA